MKLTLCPTNKEMILGETVEQCVNIIVIHHIKMVVVTEVVVVGLQANQMLRPFAHITQALYRVV